MVLQERLGGQGAGGPLAVHLTHRQTADLVAAPLRILLVVVVALVVRAALLRAIHRLVRGASEGRMGRRLAAIGLTAGVGSDAGPLTNERRAARAQTIGSVLRSVVNVTVFTVVVITVLGQVGVNLAPILASAGIVGVAVGFGSQNLVKDFLSGLFLILEDQYGVGDVVDLGAATGTVESVGLRSTRIRDVRGVLWHIRNGEIMRVGNYSSAWSRALIDVTVPHGTDLAQAQSVLTQTADEVWNDPAYVGLILEQPAVWGVDSFTPAGVTLRLAVRRRNGQDAIDRDLRGRLVTAFAVAGIPLAATPTRVELVPPQPARP